MGFALWLENEVARAEGTHEYRPMGIAVIAITDLFHARDFRPRNLPPQERTGQFAGYFASVGDLNQFLHRRRYANQTTHPHHHGGVLSDT